MRRLLPLLGSIAILACDSGVSGRYALVSVDGEALPYSFELFGTLIVTSGTLIMGDSTFEYTIAASDPAGNDESWSESGTFTLGESSVLCMTTEEVQPPPPPRPGDTVSSMVPLTDARTARPEPDSTTHCGQVWSGEEIGLGGWVFRR
jgi:hypothetical protein